MPISQAQKKAKSKWDKENMTQISCRLTKEKAAKFKQACQILDTVPNRVMLKAVSDTIQAADDLMKSNESRE
jgi:Rod binding domain-containing protein